MFKEHLPKHLAEANMSMTVTMLSAGFVVTWFLCVLLYSAFFHPLRNYPGPRLWALSRVPYAYACATGQGHRKILQLHIRYGDVVRVAPNELCFCSPEAWQEIFGRRKNATGEIGKDSIHYSEAADSILGAPKDKHAKLRLILSRGFSNRAVLDQEPMIQSHVHLLFKKLSDHQTTKGEETPIDLSKWFDFVALDIITDLGFGKAFHSLKTGHYHPWATLFLNSLRAIAFAVAIKRFRLVFTLLSALAPKSVVRKHLDMVDLTNRMVEKRLAEAERPDFIRAMSQYGKTTSEVPLPLHEIQANAQVLTMAGYDTTATALSGVTYLLAKYPDTMIEVAKEVRRTFKNDSEISILGTQNLSVLTAAIDEAMRLYPPGGSGMPREVPKGGDVIFHQYIPAGTVLTIWQYAVYHNPKNFSNPEVFEPDRWLGNEKFAGDRKEAFQPFSFGARNCIGRNLAYAELRIILAKLLWNFDFQLALESQNWLDEQAQYLLWERGPLNMKLRRNNIHK